MANPHRYENAKRHIRGETDGMNPATLAMSYEYVIELLTEAAAAGDMEAADMLAALAGAQPPADPSAPFRQPRTGMGWFYGAAAAVAAWLIWKR